VNDEKVSVLVDQGDIHLSSSFPDKEFSSSCSKQLNARNIRARGSMLRSSSLSADVKSSDSSLSVSFGGNVEAIINLDFQFRGEVGAKVFGKCRRILRDTIDISLTTSGSVEIEASVEAENIRYVSEDGKLLMKFTTGVSLVGRPHGWNVDNIDASRCEIKLGGRLEIGSYCSLIERELKKQVESYLNKWSRFEAPKLVEKLEAKLQKKIGEEVVIELFKF